ncbi:MAG: APC family permease [Lachnospiraceae bacterium]|jgi:APA family basic amino acid/polyamine antiporter|nr:APC family permease [Lachnospiraceae bacterium]
MANKDGKIGLLDTTTILVGGMIGSAIFSLSGVTLGNAGASAILSWVVAGLILLSYGLICAELCSTYPNSGGVFLFPAKAFAKDGKENRLWGWISAWAYLFGCVGGLVFSASYVATYLGIAVPALQVPNDPYMSPKPEWALIIGIGTVLICGILNIFKIAVTGKANTALTIILAATMIIFVIVAFTAKTPEGVTAFNGANFSPFFNGTQGGAGFFTAIPVAMLAYGSIVAAAFMVGEIRDPNKTVPKAMSIAMAITVGLYVLVMVATVGLISIQMLNETHMTYTPQFGAAWMTLGHITWLPKLVSAAAVLGLLTTALVLVILAARTLQAAAFAGVLPKFIAKNNEKTGIPLNATIIVTVLGVILVAFPSLTTFIINFGGLSNALVVVALCVTVIKARSTKAETGFKAPGGNVLPIVTMAILVACYIIGIMNDVKAGTYDILKLLIATVGYFAVGLIIYFVCTKAVKSE